MTEMLKHLLISCTRPSDTCHTATLESVANIMWQCGSVAYFSRFATLFHYFCHTAKHCHTPQFDLTSSVRATLPHFFLNHRIT